MVRTIFGEFLRCQHGTSQAAGELLEPRRQIYRGADAGKVQPVAAADIAVEHVAQMKRQSKAHRGAVAACGPQSRDFRARDMRGLERRGAHGRVVRALPDREYRQQPVAHEFKNLAALFDDRRHLAIEIAIEQTDQSVRRQPVGEPGEAAHVGQPDRGVNVFGVAAPDAAGKDALAGVLADIGRQQIAGGAISATRVSGAMMDSISAMSASEKPPGRRVAHEAV